MTRTDIIRAVAEIVDVLDRYVDSDDTEDPTFDAAHVSRIRQALGLHPSSQELTLDAIARITSRVAELDRENVKLYAFESQVREQLALIDGREPTLDALQRVMATYHEMRADRPVTWERDLRACLLAGEGETTLAAAMRVRAHSDQMDAADRHHADQNIAARRTLGAKDNETTAAAAERLLDRLRDMVKKIDDADADIGRILGISPATDVKLAITHMVQELKEARARLEGRNVA